MNVRNGRGGGEKYSLRPRSAGRRKRSGADLVEVYAANTQRNNSATANCKNANKSQRPAAPLSKYRRKTANARERSRMREINLAFETLRKAVPSYMPQLVFPGDGSNEKLTKITTLRLAMKYITGLADLLHRDLHCSSHSFRPPTPNCLLNSTRKYETESEFELVEQDSHGPHDSRDTCTLTALNTSTYDYDQLLNINLNFNLNLNTCNSAPNNCCNDGGSDGESLHSGATIDNFIENSIECLVPDLNLDFPDHFFNPDLS